MQRTAYEMRISDWSSDVCSSDLIEGEKGAFVLSLRGGGTIRAEAVILAIGTQGNPNLLRCAGAELPHVQYQLDDPTEYVDEHITVVGTGDAGIENALGLAADQIGRAHV